MLRIKSQIKTFLSLAIVMAVVIGFQNCQRFQTNLHQVENSEMNGSSSSTTVDIPSTPAPSPSPVCNWDPNKGENWAADENYWKTLQYTDIDGDGWQDICGRGACGIYCARNNGKSFDPFVLHSTAFNDASGWKAPQYAQTIRFAKTESSSQAGADVCGRGTGGVYCARLTLSGATALRLWSDQFTDKSGWSSDIYWSTIRLADVNGDGVSDICGRGANGIFCALSDGQEFGTPKLWTSDFNNSAGWSSLASAGSIQFVNLNNDKQADICGFDSSGNAVCAISNGASFGPVTAWQKNFTATGSFGERKNSFPSKTQVAEIPDSASAIAVCAPKNFELGACINQLVQEQSADTALKIYIAPGTYDLKSSVFIFNRQNIEIVGKASPIFTTVHISDAIHVPTPKGYNPIDSFFTMFIADSHQIKISGLNFVTDATVLGGAQRQIGVCATENQVTDGIDIEGNMASSGGNYFTIVGQPVTYESHYMAGLPGNASYYYSTRPAVVSFLTTLSLAKADPLHRGCVGAIRDVRFANNLLNLKNVGFYTAPLSRGTGAPMSPTNWMSAVATLTSANSDYYVGNNLFNMDPSCDSQTCHSAMKIQGQSNMLIEGNVIDARNSLEAFGGGAGINVAYQMVRVVIRGNHILFSPDHHYPWQAIGVQSGFAPHQWYGVGDISSYFQSGNYGLGTPALDVTINDNRLDNAGIRFFDVCHAGLGEFCNGLDSISPNVGSGLVERYVIQGNQITPPSCNRILGMRISEVFCEVDSPFDFVSRSEGANPWASSDNCLNTGAPALTSACNPNILKTRKNMACRVLGGSKCDSIF